MPVVRERPTFLDVMPCNQARKRQSPQSSLPQTAAVLTSSVLLRTFSGRVPIHSSVIIL
jgi:hypothetical protein